MGTDAQDRASTNTIADDSQDAPLRPRAQLAEGARIGRYHVLQRVGAGGMGVVYAAYDPDLDRRVAIKLLQRELSLRDSLSDGRALILREAQAMAKLSHPNVVAVHDVGVHEGAVFLAMEFVQGNTLGDWLDDGRHPWAEVVQVFRAAGRGLAAAHDAGLVHRDFKPDNVMMSDGGKVKVTDFGLARGRDERAHERLPTARSEAVPADSLRDRVASLTQTGAVIGTPAYMAPEQHLGLAVDARSDQFSFCIAFWEALYGKRPFTAEAGTELAMKVIEGEIDDVPAGSKVPGWLREIVERGLSPEPVDRWPSMAALLAELGRDPSRTRRGRMLGLAGVVVVGASIFAAREWGAARQRPCEGMADHLVGVWDADTRAQVETAVFATGVGFAASTWERVGPRLDEYRDAWIEAREDACEATQIRGEQSPALMDLRMECLDGRLRDLRALVGLLGKADATIVQNAVVVVDVLPPLEPCADAQALRADAHAPASPQIAEEIAVLEQRLSDAEFTGKAGKYAEAIAIAREVVDAAEPLGHPPLTARALRRRGVLENVTGVDTAEATLQAAFFHAVRHDLDDDAAMSATELVTFVGEARNRPAEGRQWAQHASAYADRAGHDLMRAAVMHALAGVAFEEGKYDEARDLAGRVLEIRQAQGGPRHESVLSSLNLLGLIASDTGRNDEARALFQRGLATAQEILGADHPDTAKFINNLAKISWREGKYDEARAAFEQALQLQENALGPDHRNVAQLENNLAAVAESTGDHEEAKRRFERALAIWRKALGPEHPMVADALNNLAVVAVARGEFEEAREYDERALAIREKVMAKDHPDLAQNYNNLGTDFHRLQQYERARELHARALAIYEVKLAPEHDDIAMTLSALADDLLALGDPNGALPLAERAHRMREHAAIDPVQLANTQWALARALFDAKERDRPRAIQLAEKARATFAAAPMSPDNRLAEISAWLRRHARQ